MVGEHRKTQAGGAKGSVLVSVRESMQTGRFSPVMTIAERERAKSSAAGWKHELGVVWWNDEAARISFASPFRIQPPLLCGSTTGGVHPSFRSAKLRPRRINGQHVGSAVTGLFGLREGRERKRSGQPFDSQLQQLWAENLTRRFCCGDGTATRERASLNFPLLFTPLLSIGYSWRWRNRGIRGDFIVASNGPDSPWNLGTCEWKMFETGEYFGLA